IAANSPAQFLQALVERRNSVLTIRIVGSPVHEQADAPHAIGLLRARHQRPRRRRAADKRDEVAASHGLTPTPRTRLTIAGQAEHRSKVLHSGRQGAVEPLPHFLAGRVLVRAVRRRNIKLIVNGTLVSSLSSGCKLRVRVMPADRQASFPMCRRRKPLQLSACALAVSFCAVTLAGCERTWHSSAVANTASAHDASRTAHKASNTASAH